ncbi:MAG: RNA methyltransferase [Myxococcales bacterium]|nr:RNA methyltransferase [Polyangiaceae bacterium]MDW8251028.1 RNA methyltransferase [Myxococcales bacterium]
MRPVYLALLHYPVLDREGQIITTTITNLDLHDMARSARTYALDGFFVVHPIEAQRLLAARIRDHWTEGSGGKRIPDRPAALELIRIVPTVESMLDQLTLLHGTPPQLWTTAAQAYNTVVPYTKARTLLAEEGPPVVLVFGTGWGLATSVLEGAALRLEPIVGRGGWNHLSVRAACAISLDRLL